MPQCLVATVTPVVGARPSFMNQSTKGKRLSAPGCKEFTIGQAMPLMAFGQPQRPRANYSKIDQQAPYAHQEEQQGRHELAYDSDGEVFTLCPLCQLPLGDSGYTKDDDEGRLVHGECKAELILKAAKKEEEKRFSKDAALKKKRREEYDLGWKVERVPLNMMAANMFQCGPLPGGLCSVAWDQKTKMVTVVPAPEHSASVNMEYLSLALRVRMQEGREPVFSLDPKVCFGEPQNKDDLWQVKRFEPAWLEGTSVGEVMFQADYHLKELSMGEYSQPVVGMRSSFDLSKEEGLKQEWSAREWFVVNKADVHLTDGNVVVPVVKMGVEARETRKGDSGLEDVPLTRPDHPLVKYAESFTHYFDLIAERKSVVYHLRELAKASVVAKFLVENEARLDDRWTSLGGTQMPPSSKEIPQLWNEHRAAQIQVRGGQIVSSEEGIQTRMLGVYGGADLAVGRVGVRAPPAKVTAARVPTLTARMISARGAVPEFAVGAPGVPKGVDLNLDKFELTAAEQSAEETTAAWSGKDFLGGAFWQSLEAGPLAKEHQGLLQDVFHPALSDRRDEGERFVPPSNSLPYVSKLQELVKEEAAIRSARKQRFLSADFAVGNAGPLFPASWTPSLGVATGERPAGVPEGLHPRPDYKEDAARLIKTATPTFDEKTEDGTRFRVYRVGNIEVRSTQELDSEEDVGAVFSTRAAAGTTSTEECWSTIAKVDHVVKVSEYVEKTQNEARRFYVVLETDQGDMIVTEKCKDQTVVWAENPSGLEYRNSLAKVIRSADLEDTGFQVRDAKRIQKELVEACGNRCSCKHYSHDAFLGLLPARLKAFGALSERERAVAEELGVGSPAAWDEGRAEIFNRAWSSLGSIRQEAAKQLGFSEDCWGVPGRTNEKKEKKAEKDDRSFEELTQEEKEARVEKWFNETYGTAMMGAH